MATVGQAIQVSILAMGIIFLVLSILIGIIQVMVKILPYEEPPPAPAKRSPQAAAASGSDDTGEVIAAIHTAVARHRGQEPAAIQITQIQQR